MVERVREILSELRTITDLKAGLYLWAVFYTSDRPVGVVLIQSPRVITKPGH